MDWVDSEHTAHLWILALQEGAHEPLVLVSCWAAAAERARGQYTNQFSHV